MADSKSSKDVSSSKQNGSTNTTTTTLDTCKPKAKGWFSRKILSPKSLTQNVICRRRVEIPNFFLAKRRQMRTLSIENVDEANTNENTGLLAVSSSTNEFLPFRHDTVTFDQYTQQLEDALTLLHNVKREEYESQIALKVLRFLENLIHQPKEWISGAKLKLLEMKFPETAMTLMNAYTEDFLFRHTTYEYCILLYNSMSNFTDHKFDKDGVMRQESAKAGFIDFACKILRDSSYRELLRQCYVIDTPEKTMNSNDFRNYQKIMYICDFALTILYNMANMPELKQLIQKCNVLSIIAEYTKLTSDTVRMEFKETNENAEYAVSIKELQDIVCAIRVTSCLLFLMIMNDDEDNLSAVNTSDILPLLSDMLQKCKWTDQRVSGFSLVELVDGLSKLMVHDRTHQYIDQNLVDLLLNTLENTVQDNSVLECVSRALLSTASDEKVYTLLDTERARDIITSTGNTSNSQLVQKNCEAILLTLNRIPYPRIPTISDMSDSQEHIMISYNRSVSSICWKIRDNLKALHYQVWLDIDDINGGVLQSMAKAIERSSIVLICMNEQYSQSDYCKFEAEYATELRKPCIPCLMQPRFRPNGWLGIIKGAKMHVDFATLPFEQAFAMLIREIESIYQANATQNSNAKLKLDFKPAKPLTSNSRNPVINCDRHWLDRIDIFKYLCGTRISK